MNTTNPLRQVPLIVLACALPLAAWADDSMQSDDTASNSMTSTMTPQTGNIMGGMANSNSMHMGMMSNSMAPAMAPKMGGMGSNMQSNMMSPMTSPMPGMGSNSMSSGMSPHMGGMTSNSMDSMMAPPMTNMSNTHSNMGMMSNGMTNTGSAQMENMAPGEMTSTNQQ